MDPKPMTVKMLIQQLHGMNPDLPVCVSDGMAYRFYNLDMSVTVEEFVSDAGITFCDIGVGYCREE